MTQGFFICFSIFIITSHIGTKKLTSNPFLLINSLMYLKQSCMLDSRNVHQACRMLVELSEFYDFELISTDSMLTFLARINNKHSRK